jgi:hypothetical protein
LKCMTSYSLNVKIRSGCWHGLINNENVLLTYVACKKQNVQIADICCMWEAI